MKESEYQQITSKELADWDIDVNFTYAGIGMLVSFVSPRWKKAGVLPGEFIFSTSHTGPINSQEKMSAALSAPDGTELFFQKVESGKVYRRKVTL